MHDASPHHSALYFNHHFQLAKRQMNVVLISKSYDNLLQLVAKIRELHKARWHHYFEHFIQFSFPSRSESEYGVEAYGIHADFSLGRHVYQEIDDALQGFEVGILGELFC